MAEGDVFRQHQPGRDAAAPAAARGERRDGKPVANPLLGQQRAVGNKAVQRLMRTAKLPPGVILGQQQTVGNKGVQRLMRRHGLELPGGASMPAADEPAATQALAMIPALQGTDEERVPPVPAVSSSGRTPVLGHDVAANAGIAPPTPLVSYAGLEGSRGQGPMGAGLARMPLQEGAPVHSGYIGWPALQRQDDKDSGGATKGGDVGLKEAAPAGGKAGPPVPTGVKGAPGPTGKVDPNTDPVAIGQALLDYIGFTSSNYAYPGFTIGKNGRFDVDYRPAAKELGITIRVAFKFIDDPADPTPAGKWAPADKKAYVTTYLSQVTSAWDNRFTFKNVREPQVIWKHLGPVHVNLNVVDVTAAGKGHHFEVQASKAAGGAAVNAGVVKLFKGDETPQAPFFQKSATAGELARLAAINPGPIPFANNSTTIPASHQPKLEFLATHLRRVNVPTFDITITGHASASGTGQYNQKISEKRAQAVEQVLKDHGATNHNLIVKGVGETGAANTAEWRKVTITPAIQAGYVNTFSTIPHEFGHMIGMGDEYKTPSAAAQTTHYDLVSKAFGKEYADLVATRGTAPTTTGQSANVMDVGNDIRIYDYVTFWSALAETTLKKAPLPTPKFGYDDWKFNE